MAAPLPRLSLSPPATAPCPFWRDQRSANHHLGPSLPTASLPLAGLPLAPSPPSVPSLPRLLAFRSLSSSAHSLFPSPFVLFIISSSISRASDESACPPLSWPGARSLSLTSVQAWQSPPSVALWLLSSPIDLSTGRPAQLESIRTESTAGFLISRASAVFQPLMLLCDRPTLNERT